MVYTKTRGLRNNNPGNIRHGAKWTGLAPEQPDPAFATFTDAVFGIRALNKILRTYTTKYGLTTVRGIVSRWAPPNENDTDSYVEHVARVVGVDPDAPINVQASAYKLTRAIIKHENGLDPYDDATILRGVQMGWA